MFSKARSDGKDPLLSILEYRTTPLDSGFSPSQLLMGRRLRSILPSTPTQLKPMFVDHAKFQKTHQMMKERQKLQYDKGSKPLSDLDIGETVRIKRHTHWESATVIKQNDALSYTVGTPDRGVYRRSRQHLLKTNEKTVVKFSTETPNIADTPKIQNPISDDPKPETLPKSDLIEPSKTPNTHLESKSPMLSTQKLEDSALPYVTRSGRTVIKKVLESM